MFYRQSRAVIGHPNSYRGRPGVDIQVVEEAFEVCSNCPPGDAEPCGDLFVFKAKRDEPHDFGFARGEERRSSRRSF